LFRKSDIVTKCLGSMKSENLSTSCIRFEIVRKSGLDACRFV
jgi:hypothetical protein